MLTGAFREYANEPKKNAVQARSLVHLSLSLLQSCSAGPFFGAPFSLLTTKL